MAILCAMFLHSLQDFILHTIKNNFVQNFKVNYIFSLNLPNLDLTVIFKIHCPYVGQDVRTFGKENF
jgi:hypothetical protein